MAGVLFGDWGGFPYYMGFGKENIQNGGLDFRGVDFVIFDETSQRGCFCQQYCECVILVTTYPNLKFVTRREIELSHGV